MMIGTKSGDVEVIVALQHCGVWVVVAVVQPAGEDCDFGLEVFKQGWGA